MAFRDNDRDFGRNRDRGNSGRNFGGRDGGRGRDRGRSFGGRDRGKPQMHDAVCADCGKECQVPFRPTGGKPVLCRDCFGGNEGNSDNRRERPAQSSAPSVTPAQFKELSAKVDKILEILENIDFEDEEEFEDE